MDMSQTKAQSMNQVKDNWSRTRRRLVNLMKFEAGDAGEMNRTRCMSAMRGNTVCVLTFH